MGVVSSSEVISTLTAHKSVAVILVFRDPCLKCRCKVVQWGVAEEDLPYSRRNPVQLRRKWFLSPQFAFCGAVVDKKKQQEEKRCNKEGQSRAPSCKVDAADEMLPRGANEATRAHTADGCSVI